MTTLSPTSHPSAPPLQGFSSIVVRLATLVGILFVNLAPVLVQKFIQLQPVLAWRKGPFSFEKPGYPPPGSEFVALVLLAACVDLYLVAWCIAKSTGLAARLGPRSRLLLQVVFVACFFVVLEGGLRMHVRAHLCTPFRPSAATFWKLQPNLRAFTNSTGGYLLNTDSHGFRGVRETSQKTAPGVLRIMTVGDSGPFGHGVDDAQTWQSRLELLLQQQFPGHSFEVINACCPGWTTTEAIRFLQSQGFDFRPDILVIGFNNDSGFDYMEEKDRPVYSPAITRLRETLYCSELYLLLRSLLESRVQWSGSPGEPPGPDRSRPVVRRLSRADFEQNIRTLIDLSRTHSCSLVLINNPVQLSVYANFHSQDGQEDIMRKLVDFSYRESLKRIAAESGTPLLDAHQKWQHVEGVDLFLPKDFLHPNAAGHELLAHQVADILREAGLVR